MMSGDRHIERILKAFDTFRIVVVEGSALLGLASLAQAVREVRPGWRVVENAGPNEIDAALSATGEKMLLLAQRRLPPSSWQHRFVCRIELEPFSFEESMDYLLMSFQRQRRNPPLYTELVEAARSAQGFAGVLDEYVTNTLAGFRYDFRFVTKGPSPGSHALMVLRAMVAVNVPWPQVFLERLAGEEWRELHANFMIDGVAGDLVVTPLGYKYVEIVGHELADAELAHLIEVVTATTGLGDGEFASLLKVYALSRVQNESALHDLFNKEFSRLYAVANFRPLLAGVVGALTSFADYKPDVLFQFLTLLQDQVHADGLWRLTRSLLEMQDEYLLTPQQRVQLHLEAKRLEYQYGRGLDLPLDRDADEDMQGLTGYEQGLSARKRGAVAESITHFEAALADCANESLRTEIRQALALSLAQAGRHGRAAVLFEQCAREFHTLGDRRRESLAVFNFAISLENGGEIQRSEEITRGLLAAGDLETSVSISIRLFQSYLDLRRGRWLSAIETCQELLARRDQCDKAQWMNAHFYAALAYIELGQETAAEKSLLAFVEHIAASGLQRFWFKEWQVRAALAIARRRKDEVQAVRLRLVQDLEKVPSKYVLEILECVCELDLFLEDLASLEPHVRKLEAEAAGLTHPYWACDVRYFQAALAQATPGRIAMAKSLLTEYIVYAQSVQLRPRLQKGALALARIALRDADWLGVVRKTTEALEYGLHAELLTLKALACFKLSDYPELRRCFKDLEQMPHPDMTTQAIFNFILARVPVDQTISFVPFNLAPPSTDVQIAMERVLEHFRVESHETLQVHDEKRLVTQVPLAKLKERCAQSDFVYDTWHDLVDIRALPAHDLNKSSMLKRLLRFFMENPHDFHTKEDLISYIWNENYNPDIHDSIVYVNVHRLRTLFKKNGVDDAILNDSEKYRLNPRLSFKLIAEKRMFEKNLSGRQIWILNYLKYNERISNQKYCEIRQVSPRTALRDLKSLLDKGYVKPYGTGKKTEYRLA